MTVSRCRENDAVKQRGSAGSIRATKVSQARPRAVTGDLTGNFLRQGDSPGEAVLDAAGFRAAFKQRYTGPEVENTLARLRRTEEGRVFTRILDGNDARVTVDAATIRRMEDVEKVFQGLVRREAQTPGAEAQAMVAKWFSPRNFGDSLMGVKGSDPVAWVQSLAHPIRTLRELPKNIQITGADAAMRMYRLSKKTAGGFDPAAHRLGDYAKEVHTVGLRAVARQNRADEELTLLFDQWTRNGEKILDNTAELLTSNAVFSVQFRGQKAAEGRSGRGAPVTVNTGTDTPWTKFKRYLDTSIRAIRTEEGADRTLVLRGIASAFVPTRTDFAQALNEKLIPAVLGATKGLPKSKLIELEDALGRVLTPDELARAEFDHLVKELREATRNAIPGDLESPERNGFHR